MTMNRDIIDNIIFLLMRAPKLDNLIKKKKKEKRKA